MTNSIGALEDCYVGVNRHDKKYLRGKRKLAAWHEECRRKRMERTISQGNGKDK